MIFVMEQRARRARRAGFVLVGGTSSRMGRDKAQLPWGGSTLVEHVAGLVEAATGSVSLVGPQGRYERFGHPVIPDRSPDRGPLGGIEAALKHSDADWNLVVACDMPALTAGFLRSLLRQAEDAQCQCLLPVSPLGIEPLCAVYHRDCRDVISEALELGVRKVTDGLAGLRTEYWMLPDADRFVNVNTPEDWTHYCAARAGGASR